jgi:transposase
VRSHDQARSSALQASGDGAPVYRRERSNAKAAALPACQLRSDRRLPCALRTNERSPKGGRPPVGHREALAGILFVLRTGIPWQMLPPEMGCGSGMTCWRRLRDWQEAGVWDRLHHLLLAQLHAADRIDWSRAVVDSSSVRAVLGGQKQGPTRPIAARRQQAPRPQGCGGRSLGHDAHGGQRSRSDTTRAADRSHSAGTRQARPTASPTGARPGRSRLRLLAASP